MEQAHVFALGDKGKAEQIWSAFEASVKTVDEIVAGLAQDLPEIVQLRELWTNTPLKHLQLTSVGIAIGYANLRRVCPGFDANLSIWIN